MANEEEDVKQPSESSTEGNSPDEGEEPSTQEGNVDEQDENKVPYSRFKEVNDEKKELEDKLEEFKSKLPEEKDSKEGETSKADVDRILEVTSATEGLDRDEVKYLKTLSTAKDKSLSEAREDDDFKRWRQGREQEIKKEQQTPEPDSRRPTENKEFADWTPEDLRNASDDKQLEYLEWKKNAKPGEAAF